jgi:LacI family transcriptional regulator
MMTAKQALKGLFVPNAMVHFFAKAFWRFSPRETRPKLIGYDLIPENVAAIHAGNIDFVISQRPEVQGYEGIMTLYRKLVLKEQVVAHTTMPIDIITKENVASFGAQT